MEQNADTGAPLVSVVDDKQKGENGLKITCFGKVSSYPMQSKS